MARTLTDNPTLGTIQYSILFFQQGVAIGLYRLSFPAYLAHLGVSAAEIASLLVCLILPWSFKWVGGPIVDRLSFFAMGRRRAWIIFGQIILILLTAVFVFFDDIPHQLMILSVVFLLYNIISCVQFVAIDAQLIEYNTSERYNYLSGYTEATTLVGVVIGAAGLGTLLTHSHGGWIATIIAISIIYSINLFYLITLRETEDDSFFSFGLRKHKVQTTELPHVLTFKQIFKQLWQVSKEKNYLIFMFFILISGIPSGTILALAPVMAVKGFLWTDAAYSQVIGIIYPVVGIIFSIIGAFLCGRIGRIKVLYLSYGFYILAYVVMGLLHSFWLYSHLLNILILPGFAAVYAAANTLNLVAMLALGMRMSHKYIAGTQYSIYISLANFSNVIGSALYGLVSHWLDFHLVLFTLPIFDVFAIILLVCLRVQIPKEHTR